MQRKRRQDGGGAGSGLGLMVALSVLTLEMALLIGMTFPTWESASVDWRMRWRYHMRLAAASKPARDLVLVEIDDTSLRQIGRWGAGSWISRRPFLDQLRFFEKHLSPTVVAYDILFQETTGALAGRVERVSESSERIRRIVGQLDQLSQQSETLLDLRTLDEINRLTIEQGNAILAYQCAAIADSDAFNLLLGCFFQGGEMAVSGTRVQPWSDEDIMGESATGDEKQGKRVPYLLDMAIPPSDVEPLQESGPDPYGYCENATLPSLDLLDYAYLGPLNGLPDPDGVVRRVPIVIGFRYENRVTREIRTRFVPSFSLMAYLLHGGVRFPLGKGVVRVRLGRDVTVTTPRMGTLRIPVDEAGRLYVNFEHALKDFPHVSFARVAPARYGDAEAHVLGDQLAGLFTNRVTVVAVTATKQDEGGSPLGSPVPLVLVHLAALDNMLTGHYLAPLSRGGQWGVMALVFIAFTLVCAAERSARLGPAAAGCILAYLLLAFVGILFNWVILPLVSPFFYMVFCSFSVLTYRFFTEEKAKRRIRGMFSSMVSDRVLSFLEESPDSFSLTGHSAEVTVFFSDVQQFTTIGESLPPDQLTRFLNAYLTPVTNCILESGGYLDKYVGDGIMAVWGAPYRDAAHATKACVSALEQQRIVARLNRDLEATYGKAIYVRMGINSGIVTAGNMGSERKFQYTVMGDVVNLAARLEPVNKDFGTRVIIGEATHAMVKDHFVTRPLCRIQVKGKSRVVTIHELVAEAGQADEATQRVVEGYTQALQAFESREWSRALERVEAVLAIRADDGPAQLLRRRIAEFEAAAPPEGWQGEYVRSIKD